MVCFDVSVFYMSVGFGMGVMNDVKNDESVESPTSVLEDEVWFQLLASLMFFSKSCFLIGC